MDYFNQLPSNTGLAISVISIITTVIFVISYIKDGVMNVPTTVGQRFDLLFIICAIYGLVRSALSWTFILFFVD